MSDENNTRQHRLLEEKTTEELQKMIREDACGTKTYAPEFMEDVLAELARRDPVPEEQKSAAWDRLQQSLLDEEAEKISAWTGGDNMPKKRGRWSWAGRVGAMAASLALIIAVFAMPVRGNASAYTLLVDWTDTLFSASYHYTEQPADTQIPAPDLSNEGLAQLQETLHKNGIYERVVPTWIPDGYALSSTDTHALDAGMYISGTFSRGEEVFSVVFSTDPSDEAWHIEKDGKEVEIILADGISYYIMSNNSVTSCYWANGRMECIITGDLTREELVMIVQSISTE